ncbi:response regulator transcription factor [Hydrogenophaga sp. D2P1]|uniref:Response regulator transcription factor n=1 Tax=Hydrogenophaga aromaticivorans TaxID=2610898 RepID=A0A7Y8GZQ2_9BURK|nr:response regulator transcription factor [Hydrogenophaga aromaticivorans]NWF47378.1 response regulator transcription factor [Hydrogenophaga aromaticivorans]
MSNIYLVDDHTLMRDGLRSLLEAAGHRVVGESADPTQALAQLRELGPVVVLLDLHLVQRSGFELLTELQRRAPEVRSIVLTMSAQPRHVAEALKLGAAGYVLKGSPASLLLQAVDLVSKGQRFLGPEVAELAVQGFTAPGDDALDTLSVRERQIVLMVVQGQSSSEIGRALHLSPKTVDSYRSRIMAKLAAPDVPALVRFAIRNGLIDAGNA